MTPERCGYCGCVLRFRVSHDQKSLAPPDLRAEVIREVRATGRWEELRERMAALLCFAEGYSHVEAAQIMGLPLGTLKSIVARARRGLVECLEDDRDDG